MKFMINPGTGPVLDATRENAVVNIRAFHADLKFKFPVHIAPQPKQDYGEGRYAFELYTAGDYTPVSVIVQMPGLPLERVRYYGNLSHKVYDFPRLYVDGSSWLWEFAVSMARERFAGVTYNNPNAQQPPDETV